MKVLGITGKNAAKIERLQLFPQFEYHRFEDKSAVTICKLEDNNRKLVSVGFSVMSPKDVFIKAVGRNSSAGRAIAAFEHKSNVFKVEFTKRDTSALQCMKFSHWGLYGEVELKICQK